jgi:hypothetical protein
MFNFMGAFEMIKSKVIRNKGFHITRADYGDVKPILHSENVVMPSPWTMQALALNDLLKGTVTHRSFDAQTRTYRLAASIDALRTKGWPIVNHDEACIVDAPIKRIATYTRYELYADFSQELRLRVNAFVKGFDALNLEAAI